MCENSIITLAKPHSLCYNSPVAWSGIEVVITALTRNQVTGNRPWVRIPPAPHCMTRMKAASFHAGFLFPAISRKMAAGDGNMIRGIIITQWQMHRFLTGRKHD